MRTLLCPGDTITYTCAFVSTAGSGAVVSTQWTGSGFLCPSASPVANTIILTQQSGSSLSTAVVSCGNLSAVMTNVSGTCYTSVLTIPTPQYYNGTTVVCKDTSAAVVGNLTLQLACKLDVIYPTYICHPYCSNFIGTTFPHFRVPSRHSSIEQTYQTRKLIQLVLAWSPLGTRRLRCRTAHCACHTTLPINRACWCAYVDNN